MKQYKTELHCHSKYVSGCSSTDAEDIISQYLEYGYTTVVITDHLSEGSLRSMTDTEELSERIEFFLSGYRTIREAARGRLNILLGCEIRFPNTGGTDFLIYGADEAFFRNNPDMYRHDRWWTCALVHNNGFMIFQAHPFRCGMMLCEPHIIDGVEVFNGHPGQRSHNRLAEEWQKEYPHLIGISGGDHHDRCHLPDAGIRTDAPITTNAQLLEVLRSGAFELIRDTDTMEESIREMKGNR